MRASAREITVEILQSAAKRLTTTPGLPATLGALRRNVCHGVIFTPPSGDASITYGFRRLPANIATWSNCKESGAIVASTIATDISLSPAMTNAKSPALGINEQPAALRVTAISINTLIMLKVNLICNLW